MSKRYRALLNERAELVAEGKSLLQAADNEGRELTDDEKQRDDAIHARLQVLGDELERHERLRAVERTAPAGPDANMRAAQEARIEGMHDRAEDDPTHGFAHIGEFANAVKTAFSPGGGQVDQRLRYGAAPTNYHYESGGDEGQMVPPAFREEVWEAVTDYSSILADLDPEPTGRNSVEYLRDESTPWGSTGVQARWRTEESQMTATKLATEPSTLRLHELYAFVTATASLLSDAPRLNARLTRKAGQAIAWKIDDTVVNGDGVGKPLGWYISSALVTVAKESGQSADTVVADNIAKMYARLINPGQGIWYINQDVMPEIVTLTLGDQPIWMAPNSGFRDAPEGGFLLGRPVRFLEACQTLGNKGDIQFVNPMGYYALTRSTMPEFASSMHLYFDYAMEAFRWTFRMGGQPFLSAAISPANGSKSRSHFVTLAERA